MASDRANAGVRGRRRSRQGVASVMGRCSALLLATLIMLWSEPRARAVETVSPPGVSAPGVSPPGPAVLPSARAAANLAVITIEGEINAITSKSVERRIAQAVNGGANGIVFEINSPGGEVGAVLEICTQIKQCAIQNTVAWVNPTAYSGGAIIALACREIVLAPHATMGDAAPVAANPIAFAQGLRDTERQKILAPLLAELVDSARLRGYDEKLVQGFVMLGVELWAVREKQSGKLYFVDETEYLALFGDAPSRGRPHIASGSQSEADAAPAQPGAAESADDSAGAGDRGRSSAGPQMGADPEAFRPASPDISPETQSSVSMALQTASTRPTFGAADRGRFEVVEYATDGRTLLTLKESDLKRYGFSDPSITIRNDSELMSHMGSKNLVRLDLSWSESVVDFMTQGMSGMIVRGVLIVVFLMAMFIEMSMPGVGLPGGIALAALAGLVVPPMLIGASAWWAGALIICGVVCILLELFVMPGFGLPGVLGLMMLFAGLVGTFAGAGQLFPGMGPGGTGELAWAASIVLLATFIAGVGIYLFTRYTDKFPLAGKLVLADVGGSSDSEDETFLQAMSPVPASRAAVSVGSEGCAITPLRPSGTADFAGKLVDVVSEFGFVESGAVVRVTSVTDYRVAVEPIEMGKGGSGLTGGGSAGGKGAAEA